MLIRISKIWRKVVAEKKGMSQLAGTALAMTAGVGAVIAMTQYWQRGQKGIMRDTVDFQKTTLSQADQSLGRTLKFTDTDFDKDYKVNSSVIDTLRIDDRNVASTSLTVNTTDRTLSGSFDGYNYTGPLQ